MLPFKKVLPDYVNHKQHWRCDPCKAVSHQKAKRSYMTCLSNCEKTIHINTKVLPLHFTDWHNWQNRSWEIQPCSGAAATGGSCRRSHPNWWTGHCPAGSPWPQSQDHCHSPGMKLISKILGCLEHLGRVEGHSAISKLETTSMPCSSAIQYNISHRFPPGRQDPGAHFYN